MAHEMQDAIVHAALEWRSPALQFPTLGPGQLLIKTHYAASTQKDWKGPKLAGLPPMSYGDDVAGTVHAAVALWRELGAPWPWTPGPRGPILIYGASSTVGAFTEKLASFSGLGSVVAIAANGREFVESLLDCETGDGVVDCRDGEEKTVEAIKTALNWRSVHLAIDALPTSCSEKILGKLPDTATGTAKIATVLPLYPADDVQGHQKSFTILPLAFGDAKQAIIALM